MLLQEQSSSSLDEVKVFDQIEPTTETKSPEEILRQREWRVKKREEFARRRERRARVIFCMQKSNDLFWYRAQQLPRRRRERLARQSALQRYHTTNLQNLACKLHAREIELNERNNALCQLREDFKAHLQRIDHCRNVLIDIDEDLTRREEALAEREGNIAISEEALDRRWRIHNTERLKLRQLNNLLVRESERMIDLKRQESRPMVRVPPRGGYALTTSQTAAKNSSATDNILPVHQFDIDLVECITGFSVSVHDLHNMNFITERNRVREEARIVLCRALRDQFAYIWRDTSTFMRQVFEYYPLTSNENDRYISDRDRQRDDVSLKLDSNHLLDRDDAMPQLAVARDIRGECYEATSLCCATTRHIALPFCLRAEDYGLSASTTATHNCLQRHIAGRLCTSELYNDDECLPENGAPLCTSVTEPPSVAKTKIFVKEEIISDSSDENVDDSSSDDQAPQAGNDRQVRQRRRTQRSGAPSYRMNVFTTLNQKEIECDRNSFEVRRRMNRAYNPFAWMYPTGHSVTTEQLCGTHLNLGQAMKPLVLATLHYQRYSGTITEDCMDGLFCSWLIHLCGSAVMFSLLTTLRFDSIRVSTLEKYVLKVMDCYVVEANYNPHESPRRNEAHEIRNEINSKYLLQNDWSLRLPNFVGERTGAIWMMFDNRQFFGRLWTYMSENIPHVQTHVPAWDNNERAFRYRVHSTVSLICVLMARLARILAVGDYDVFRLISTEFSRLMSSDRVCLAVPFSFFCSKELVLEELRKVVKRVELSALDFKVNMYAIAYILRVRDITDAELGRTWLKHRHHSDFNQAELRVRDIVEHDIVRVRDRAFVSCDDNNTNTNTNVNDSVSDQQSVITTSITTLSIRSIAMNIGLDSARIALCDLTFPINYTVILIRYFTDCMWHFVSELPIATCTEYKPCRKCISCS